MSPDPDGGPASLASGLGEGLADLALSARYTHPDDLPSVIARAASALGAREAVLYVVDLGQQVLVPLYGRDEPDRASIPVDGSLPGHCYQSEAILQEEAPGGGTLLWVPVQDSAERLGVMAFTFEAVDGELERAAFAFAAIVGEYVVTKARYGDALERTRRLQPLTLPAEMRWSLLPPLSYHSPSTSISGLVEPCYGIAGDTFDYAMVGDDAHIALFDAVGHGLLACRVANLTVAAYRNQRRSGADLAEVHHTIDGLIASQFGDAMFVTSILAKLHTLDGTLRWVNAGHPPPLLLRGGRVVDELQLRPTLPAGLGGTVEDIGERQLEPGDTVVFFTDGVVEARSPGGELFGEERLADHLRRAADGGITAPETLRRLMAAIIEHQQGVFHDDVTAVLVTWHGPPTGRPRIDQRPPVLGR